MTRAWLLTAGLLLCGEAAAQSVTLGRFGPWEAFGGSASDGTPMCGVSTVFGDGRYFGLKYFDGEDRFTVQLIRRSWQIPRGTSIPVRMQLDANAAWTATATGNQNPQVGGVVEFVIPAGRLGNFLREFEQASVARVSFTSGSEPDWVISLSGTMAASAAMGRCLASLPRFGQAMRDARARPGQPFGKAVTQPFGGQPTSPPAPTRENGDFETRAPDKFQQSPLR